MIRYISCLTTRQAQIFKPRLSMAEIAVYHPEDLPPVVLPAPNSLAVPLAPSGRIEDDGARAIIEFLQRLDTDKRIDTLLVHDHTAGPTPAAIARYVAERYRVRLRRPSPRFDGLLYTRLCVYGPYRHNSVVLLPQVRLPHQAPARTRRVEHAPA